MEQYQLGHCPICSFTYDDFLEHREVMAGTKLVEWDEYKPIFKGIRTIFCQNCGTNVVFDVVRKEDAAESWNLMERVEE